LHVKAAQKKLVKLQHLGSISPTCLREAFTCADPKKCINSVKLSVSFCAFGI